MLKHANSINSQIYTGHENYVFNIVTLIYAPMTLTFHLDIKNVHLHTKFSNSKSNDFKI